MRRGDAAELGRLMHQSHESLRNDYEVSSEALNAMVESAGRTRRATAHDDGGVSAAVPWRWCEPRPPRISPPKRRPHTNNGPVTPRPSMSAGRPTGQR